MCTFEFPYELPNLDLLGSRAFHSNFREYITRVTTTLPDFNKIPGEYSNYTIDILEKFLVKDRIIRPILKDVYEDMEEFAKDLF